MANRAPVTENITGYQIIAREGAKVLLNMVMNKEDKKGLHIPHEHYSSTMESFFSFSDLCTISRRSNPGGDPLRVLVYDSLGRTQRVQIRFEDNTWILSGLGWDELVKNNGLDECTEISLFCFREKVQDSAWATLPRLILMVRTQFLNVTAAMSASCVSCNKQLNHIA